MSRASGVLAAMKAVPGGRYTPAPQSGGYGTISQVAANAMYGNPSRNSYGPFLPRPSRVFTDGAFGPMGPIQPVPVDEPPPGGQFPDPRWWQYRTGWNLPTQPRAEGISLASFDQLKTIADRYSVARRCIELRKEEICGLEWEIKLTTKAAKAYQGDHKAMRDFGERAAQATRFFRRPDPDYWNFSSFLKACLEEIFVFDALTLIFRPKYGKGLGRGLLGSDLDSLRLVSGPTIRPLLDMHGGTPRPPAPAYQQYLFGVPRSDYQTVIAGTDIDDYGLAGAEVNSFRADTMLYARMVPRRETPYGFPPVEQALLPIISGLQKQEFQLDYFTEGCYSDDTEILTRNGWKLFSKLAEEDEVATRSEAGEFEWQLPSARLEYPFDGEMVEFASKSAELLVTPGHRMLVKRPDAYLAKHAPRDGEDGWHIRLAEHIARAPETRWVYPVTSSWRGESPESLVIPGIASPKHPARDLVIPMREFCAFLGVFLAEGWVRSDRNDVIVAQSAKSRRLGEVHQILAATGLRWNYDAKNGKFYLCSQRLAGWLRENCGSRAWGKHVPRGFKDLSPDLLEVMLHGMMLGDGHYGPKGQRYYTTTSEQLADDVQEIFQKLGRDAWVRRETTERYPGQFGKAPVKRQVFVVRERMQDYHWLPKPKRAEYHGRVYCVTVPNGIVYVRRNGKAAWCGNTVPACYISPGDPNMTPTQIRELQDALNGIAGDPAYHLKVIVLPPGSKVDPQRAVDLSDSFDYLVMNQVCMQLDVDPTEVGIIPNVGSTSTGPSASGIRFAAQASRDIKTRKSTKPLLLTLRDIANYALQDVCGQQDMEFSFEGLQDDEDKAAITSLGVEQVQNGIASIDEVRDRLDLPPWGLTETSEPVVFTAQGPIPFSMAPQLIAAAQGGQGTNSGQRTASSRSRTSQPSVRRGGTTKPNGSHPAPLAPHREAATPGHAAAAGAVQGPSGRTGGTTSRSPVAGSRKRGEGHTDRFKAVTSELDALRRHLRKGRDIATWEPRHIPGVVMATIEEDLGKGILIDVAVESAGSIVLADDDGTGLAWAGKEVQGEVQEPHVFKDAHWPGWERDLGLVGAYKRLIGQAFHDAEAKGSELRKKAATGGMFVSNGTLRDLISDEVRLVFSRVLTPLWTEAWSLGYSAAKSLATGEPADFTAKHDGEALAGFIGSEGEHWLQQVSRTGLGNDQARSELIARTEVARAINTAAIQCYRDYGVTHKHLLTAPGACDMCLDAADDGDIPLDAPFSSGGILGLSHPGDRCIPAPSGVDAEPPLADLGKAQGYTLNSRSGMISLDLPEGTITPVPGGVTDHHITVVYLGPDVDDDAFASACQRAAIAAASLPGPLAGAVNGIGTFPPSDGSDGKVPAWAGVMLPGAERLREALEDLSASEHKDWKPHVTLAYVEPGEPLPGPLPATPVTFTHLSVHRGHDEVARFPLGPAGKSAPADDGSRLVWLLLRARDEDGKWRFLLQQRPDGSWGMPGGKPHQGEDPWAAALRETAEEIGQFPPPRITATYHHTEDGGETQVYLWLCDVPYFHPALDGETPEETLGAAWFRRREIAGLDLAPKFREDWERGVTLKDHVTKALQRAVNENGEVLTLDGPAQRLQATGARWPYPRRADGTEDVPGGTAGAMGAAEPPHQADDFAGGTRAHAPRGGDDGTMPSRGRKPAPGASRFPDQGDEDQDAWPYPQNTLTPGMTTVGAPKEKGGNDSGHPVVGSVPAKTPKPYRPHSVEPEAFDPAETVEDWSPEAGSDVVHDLPKGAQHVTDANPVEWRHVYAQLEGQFPDKALEWVKHSTWLGPLNVPWSRIDDDDIDSWAASHQPEAVQRFAREIARGGAHTNPSVLFHQANHSDGREVIADGHHRAMARHFKLGKPVLAYVGTVPPRWMRQALETHSSQLHQGADPANKSAQTPVVSTVHHPLGREGLWRTPDKHVPHMQELPAYVQNTARALMRDQDMEESHAIATAINAIDEWRHGTAFGGKQKVTPQVQEAAQRAWQEWEDLKASHHEGDA